MAGGSGLVYIRPASSPTPDLRGELTKSRLAGLTTLPALTDPEITRALGAAGAPAQKGLQQLAGSDSGRGGVTRDFKTVTGATWALRLGAVGATQSVPARNSRQNSPGEAQRAQSPGRQRPAESGSRAPLPRARNCPPATPPLRWAGLARPDLPLGWFPAPHRGAI